MGLRARRILNPTEVPSQPPANLHLPRSQPLHTSKDPSLRFLEVSYRCKGIRSLPPLESRIDPAFGQRAVIHGNAARVYSVAGGVQWLLPDQNRVPRPLRVIQTVVGAPKINKEHKGATRKENGSRRTVLSDKEEQDFREPGRKHRGVVTL